MSKREAEDAVDRILEYLKDGVPHDPGRMAEDVGLPTPVVEEILSFLSERGWVEYNHSGAVRITESGRKFVSLPT